MTELSVGTAQHGFTLVSRTELPEHNGIGCRYRHDATGMEVFHIANDDPENVFSFVFKTPPRNSYGTPHIIEHSVLEGSRLYPTKDPFLSLMKGSANTFLNAMTYPDKTLYPAASPLKKDYYNLLSVYADAVFFPLLRKETFKQEGIRTTVSPSGELGYDGIVFNEMKGAYSDHDSIVSEYSIRSLFPDTAYGYDSGGDPKEIIHLTYDEFKGFHAEFYHPSNCRLFLYGDIPAEEQLKFLQEEFLKDFTAIHFSHEVQDPKVWKAPVELEYTSPINEEESPEGKSTITINWHTCSIYDPLDVMTLEVLTEALLGNPGAPLYKAIIDSGLGTDISSVSGMDSQIKQVVFSLGVRGSDPDKKDAFVARMFDELKRLVSAGIPADLVGQAIKRIEFQQKELRGGLPSGIRAMSRAVRGWLHGMAPEDTLMFEPVLDRLKALVSQCTGPGYLEKWINEHLLHNDHYSVVVVRPDARHTSKIDSCFQSSLEEMQKKLGKKQLKQLTEEHERFLLFQQTPDPDEVSETVPRLQLADLPLDIRRLDVQHRTVGTTRCCEQQMFTNGVVYLDLAFDLSGLDERQMDLLPLFSRLLYMTGIPGFSYAEVSRSLAEVTGGFSSRLETAVGGVHRHLLFRSKMLKEDVQEALQLIGKILITSELWDIKRIRDIILEQRSDFMVNIIPSGNAYAALRASASLNVSAQIEDRWKGLGQWEFINGIEDEDEKQLLSLAKELTEIRQKVLCRDRMLAGITCDEESSEEVRRNLLAFSAVLPVEEERAPVEPDVHLLRSENGGEAYFIPSQVAYTALACRTAPYASREQTAQSVLTHILRTSSFWESIRVKGGAYGASASVDVLEELCLFSSYRDPRIAGTFEDYHGALRTIVEEGVGQEVIDLSVISMVGKDLRPMSPGEKGYIGFKRDIYGITDEIRARRREQLLSITKEDIIHAAGELLAACDEHSSFVVLSSREMYLNDKDSLPEWIFEKERLPL